MEEKTLVIIPAYNEEKNIGQVVKNIFLNYPKFDVAVINDGSKDKTAHNALKELAVVINHPYNLGYGVSIQTGYKFAVRNGYDYLIQVDGDGQHEITSIGKIHEKLMLKEHDFILGSRFLDFESYTPSILRRFGIIFFRFVVNRITGLGLSDITTGFQGMNRKTLKFFVKDSFPFDYPDADVLVLAHKRGLRIGEVAVRMHESNTGKSMHSNLMKNMIYVVQMFISLFILLLRKKDRS